jgi:putative DNA primase/helicase
MTLGMTDAAIGEDVAEVAALRGTLAAKVGGDSAFGSAHQPVRVAGTIHGKKGLRARVRILEYGPHEYALNQMRAAIAAMPSILGLAARQDAARGHRVGPTVWELATTRISAGSQDGVTRFTALSMVIGHWVRCARLQQCSIEAAWTAVLEHNTAMIDPPWEEDRLRREFDALLRKDVAANGAFPKYPARQASDDTSAAVAPPLSDDALAERLVAEHGSKWKYVPAWGSWFNWRGNVWARDETGLVREQVRQVCRSASQQASSPAEARHIASDKKIAAVLRVAAADPGISVPSSHWDAHPLLLNTPAGVVDLATGDILPHDPNRLITQITTASPGSGCPRWIEFLAEITDGDVELQVYLARLAGYCLTGLTREQVFAFLHGHGANGKSVFLNSLASVMGSYAATAAPDTFMASRTERHLTELAGLRAARLVLVSETEAGRSWAEARIKAVTGGERLRANFMRQDHFEFDPQFKLLVAGNHRPSLTGVGEAMRRRLHLIPFTVTIPEDRRDLRLAENLLDERDGILGWMLEGCAAWQSEGLAPPKCVTLAVDDYFKDEDLVGQWINQCCVSGNARKAPAAQLFASWKTWAEVGGFPAGSQKNLGEALRARGFTPTTVNRARGWLGIELLSRLRSEGAAE